MSDEAVTSLYCVVTSLYCVMTLMYCVCSSLTSDEAGALLIEMHETGAEFSITGDNSQSVAFTPAVVNDGQWHHIVLTYNHAANRLELFVDQTRITPSGGMVVTSSNANNFTDL